MTNYIDSQIIPILKFVDEEINPSHIDDFVNYQIAQRFTNIYDILRYNIYIPKRRLYVLLTYNNKSFSKNNRFNIKAKEFESFYKNKIKSTDIFVYNIEKEYYFALYIDTKFCYFNSLYIEDNILNASKIEDFIIGTFNLKIENIYICSDILQVPQNSDKNISTISFSNSINPIYFKSIQQKNDNYKIFKNYLWGLISILIIYISTNIFISNQKDDIKDIIQIKTKTTQKKKDFVSLLLNISEDIGNCNISILHINIQDNTIIEVSTSTKGKLLECINNKNIDIISTTKNTNGNINATLKYSK